MQYIIIIKNDYIEVEKLKESRADLIIHPVRIRIIGALIDGRHMTTQEISECLRDVPPASLYRHLSKLVSGGILRIVKERPVRGTFERVYSLPEQAASLSQEDMVQVSREDHMRYFMIFVASLVDEFGRYLQQEHIDMLVDGVGYRQVPLHLSDEEFVEFTRKVSAIFTETLQNKPAPNRRRRMFTTIVMPDRKGN